MTKTKLLHYSFVESQDSPATDPIIVFLLGGPGVATMSLGLFGGIGPLIATSQQNATLVENPNTWNKRANLLFIDNPAGVGYSFGATEYDHSTMTTQ